MSEQVFFYIVILSILFFGLLNVFLDMKVYRKIVIQIKESNERIDNVWSQINRIDDEFKNIKTIIDIDFNKLNEIVNNKYDLLKNDILFFNDKIDKDIFEKEVIVNRLNSHAKKIAYVKKILDKLFDHKVEIKHKAKLVKLEGELDKW